jgi:hypothetical protein
MNEDSELEVTIHAPTEVRKIVVHGRDSLQSALANFPGCSQFKVIHDKYVLMGAFSFSFCGIENGAHLYAIPAVIEPRPPPKSETCDRESFCKMFTELHGSECNGELCQKCDAQFVRQMSRLKDRFFERVEGTVKCHRQLLRHFFCSKKKESESEEEEDPKKK